MSGIASPLNLLSALGDMLSNDFMQYAFTAGTAMALLGGFVGYFVILRRSTFAGEALSHVAFAAALGAVLFGFAPLLGMFVITVGVALGMGSLGKQARTDDVTIGVVLAWVLGLGALFLSIYTSSPGGGSNGQIGVNVLFGSILGLNLDTTKTAIAVAAAAILVLLAIARPLLFASIDPAVAVARGVPVRLLGSAFLVLIALTVAESVQVVGALLVLALLVMPAAIAQRWTTRPYRGLFLAAALGVAFTWIGLTIGYFEPYPVSFFITTLAVGTYFATLLWQQLRTWSMRSTPRREPASG